LCIFSWCQTKESWSSVLPQSVSNFCTFPTFNHELRDLTCTSIAEDSSAVLLVIPLIHQIFWRWHSDDHFICGPILPTTLLRIPRPGRTAIWFSRSIWVWAALTCKAVNNELNLAPITTRWVGEIFTRAIISQLMPRATAYPVTIRCIHHEIQTLTRHL